MNTYEFTNTWFESSAKPYWDYLIPRIKPKKILEIGTYEGASACYLIDNIANESEVEIHCVDSWEGGIEHDTSQMGSVETRFNRNIQKSLKTAKNTVDLKIHKSFSDDCLTKLLSSGKKEYFDFIYIDGSHQAPDVLCDAILGFKLLQKGGLMVFDDYLWSEYLSTGMDPIRCPKIAIDSFTNIYCRSIEFIIGAPIYQLYIRKKNC